jgi:deoxycytidylate deaminase
MSGNGEKNGHGEAPAPDPEPVPDGEAHAAPSKTELIIGLVGALGTDLRSLANDLATYLNDEFGYDSDFIGMSDLMGNLDWDRDLLSDKYDLHVELNMDAGRDFNLEWFSRWQRHDALARLAFLEIARLRNLSPHPGSDQPLERHAYIVRSLKRPDEVELFRAVYGDRFVLIGAYCPRVERTEWLKKRIGKDYNSAKPEKWGPGKELQKMIDRDERENAEAGQDVRDTFHRADFFIDTRQGRSKPQLIRCLRVLFGDPFITPTKDEAGMAHAATAARATAELGRQVGAAITTTRGELRAVGANEVPRAFGGPYWEDDEDVVNDTTQVHVKDGREFRRPSKIDTINEQQREIAEKIAAGLRGSLNEDADPQKVTEQVLDSGLGDITEFGRAVHAEMTAITTAARLGTSLADTTLYATTFPCHNCARHIIGTGIRRVVYIAPYAKSRAYRLHPDSLVVAPATPPVDKVIFEPFVGIAPKRYHHLFYGLKRKEDNGEKVGFDPMRATPRLADDDPPELALEQLGYTVRETALRSSINQFLPTATPSLTELPEEAS